VEHLIAEYSISAVAIGEVIISERCEIAKHAFFVHAVRVDAVRLCL
jgi:hypothetical protein